jgi:hypothetical protein
MLLETDNSDVESSFDIIMDMIGGLDAQAKIGHAIYRLGSATKNRSKGLILGKEIVFVYMPLI